MQNTEQKTSPDWKTEKAMARQKRFYRLVMPFFKIVSKRLQADYKGAFPLLLTKVRINEQTEVLDIGTGTGGLASLFLDYTPYVTGVDFSPDMLREAKKKYGNKIVFIQKAGHELKDFTDKSYDLVTAAYALHDMSFHYRQQVLCEMKRIARQNVIIFDFVKNQNPLIWAVEFMEGSYFWNFVNTIDSQLAEVFPRHRKIKFGSRMGLYICEVQ